jgi:hypothetical protein
MGLTELESTIETTEQEELTTKAAFIEAAASRLSYSS